MARSWTLLVVCLAACSGRSTPVASSHNHAPVETHPSPPPTAPRDPVRLQALTCGYGGSETAVSGLVDVESDAALHGLAATYEVHDASGALIGRNQGAVTLLVSPVARGVNDFSTQGTSPFAGDLAAGDHVRLQYFGGLAGTAPPTGGPLAVHVTLTASGGGHWDVTCTTATEWPSS